MFSGHSVSPGTPATIRLHNALLAPQRAECVLPLWARAPLLSVSRGHT